MLIKGVNYNYTPLYYNNDTTVTFTISSSAEANPGQDVPKAICNEVQSKFNLMGYLNSDYFWKYLIEGNNEIINNKDNNTISINGKLVTTT